ncbi:MAG: helix-turn-helix domain-containing protein [Actinomycetota bacterium]
MSLEHFTTIGAAARMVDRCTDTLRQWERTGLVVPARTSSGQRIYSAEDLNKLREVAASKQRGRPPGAKNR